MEMTLCYQVPMSFPTQEKKASDQCLVEVNQNMIVQQQPCAHLSVHNHCPVLKFVCFKLILQSHQQILVLHSMSFKCVTSVNTLFLFIDGYEKTAPS